MVFKVTPKEHNLLEMARLGHFDNIDIMVFENEGPIPHCHFKDNQKDSPGGCIRLDKPEYFEHGAYIDKFNSKERKEFINFMNSPVRTKYKFLPYTTNYQALCVLWNMNNEQYEIKDDIKMPDYSKLK